MGKKSEPPPPPDYTSLAKQSAADQNALLDKQTVANRPNQVTPWGSSSWTRNGDNWTETQALNPAEQRQLDTKRGFDAQMQTAQTGLLGKATDSLGKPMNFGGMDELHPGFGAVKEVQDAMMGRVAPMRAQAREAELQRLRNQGLSDNTEAFQRAVKRLDEGDTDAQGQALLAATDQYGKIFDRTGRARQQTLAERMQERNQSLNDFNALTTGAITNPTMPSFVQAGEGKAADLMGAGQAQYGAAMDGYNAKQARSGGLMKGLFGLAGNALLGPMGGMAGSTLGSFFK